MFLLGLFCLFFIHRHTGGLEKIGIKSIDLILIHRHTGGLEIQHLPPKYHLGIHRHTGGLEILTTKVIDIINYSPPHRRLRNDLACPK